MVVFVCAACGTSLKKNQVENHWRTRCGQSPVSCMDCSRDFRGMEYNGHTKCISEDEKYGGSNYKSKEKKGETKQAEWMTYVQEMVRTKKDMAHEVKEVLKILMSGNNVQNIPRKKNKFVNYVKNSLNCKNHKILEDVWAVLEAGNFRNVSTSKANEKDNTTEQNKKEEDAKNDPGKTMTDPEEEGSILSKRERKKARKMTENNNGTADPNNEKWMLSKKERKLAKKMKDQNEEDKDNAVVKLENRESKMSQKKMKKARKLKRANMDDNDDSMNIKAGSKRKLDEYGDDNVGEDGDKRKKKKRKSNKNEDPMETESPEEEAPAPGGRMKKMRKKGGLGEDLNSSLVPNTNHDQDMTNGHNIEGPFKWKTAITSILENGPEEGMKIKKVKRKVLALYMASDKGQSNARSEVEISALATKKINSRNSKFEIVQDRVKLRND